MAIDYNRIDYDKLANLDYTAHDHFKEVQSRLDEYGMDNPRIYVVKDYEDGPFYLEETPVVEVRAADMLENTIYIDRYKLDRVNKTEFEEVMFDIWEDTLKELER